MSQLLPKKYDILSNLTHLERVRPEAQAIGMGIQQDEAQEGIQSPMSDGPDGNPSVLRRISIKKPSMKIPQVKVHPLKIRGKR